MFNIQHRKASVSVIVTSLRLCQSLVNYAYACFIRSSTFRTTVDTDAGGSRGSSSSNGVDSSVAAESSISGGSSNHDSSGGSNSASNEGSTEPCSSSSGSGSASNTKEPETSSNVVCHYFRMRSCTFFAPCIFLFLNNQTLRKSG